MRSQGIRAALGLFARPFATPSAAAPLFGAQARWTHGNAPASPPQIPAPTPFVPDVDTFLTLIGRGLKQHASKFPTWDALFTLNSDQLRELGVEPPRTRRYLARWRHRFRLGQFGPGGNFKHVENGVAELAIRTTQKTPLLVVRQVVNVPPGENADSPNAVRAYGFTVKGTSAISGPYALPLKGPKARVTVTEGMWEDKRGHKVDGGERRRDEVRFKKRVAERKALREQQGYY